MGKMSLHIYTKHGTRKSNGRETETAMLPPFDTILFDFDGTLAVLNLDFAEMRRQLLTLTLSHGLPAEDLHRLYMLEMIVHATAWLQQRHPEAAAAYAYEAEQLLQGIEIEAARGSRLLPGIEELLTTLQRRQIAVGIGEPVLAFAHRSSSLVGPCRDARYDSRRWAAASASRSADAPPRALRAAIAVVRRSS